MSKLLLRFKRTMHRCALVTGRLQEGHMKVTGYLVFDVKMDCTKKSR